MLFVSFGACYVQKPKLRRSVVQNIKSDEDTRVSSSLNSWEKYCFFCGLMQHFARLVRKLNRKWLCFVSQLEECCSSITQTNTKTDGKARDLHLSSFCCLTEFHQTVCWRSRSQSSGSVTHCSTISRRLGFSMAAATRSLSLICLLTEKNQFRDTTAPTPLTPYACGSQYFCQIMSIMQMIF